MGINMVFPHTDFSPSHSLIKDTGTWQPYERGLGVFFSVHLLWPLCIAEADIIF